MKAGDRLGGAAAPFQCACGTFLGGVFGNVLPHGRVVRRMGVLVSAWVWRWARVYHIWLSLCTRTWPVQACLHNFPSCCRLLSRERCCIVVGVTGGAAMLASGPTGGGRRAIARRGGVARGAAFMQTAGSGAATVRNKTSPQLTPIMRAIIPGCLLRDKKGL